MTNQKKFFKWWWVWSPEQIELWLENLELKGWRPVKASAALTLFTCTSAEPRKMRYCADYQTSLKPEYMNLLHDDGWEFVGTGTGWIIWRKPWEQERPEIYTDPDSLIDRYKRLERMILLVLAAELFIFSSILTRTDHLNSGLMLKILFIAIICLLGYAAWHFRRSINALKRKKTGCGI